MADPLQLVGTTISDKYAVESVVGEGGFAVVYKAQHLIWKRPVAIKAFKAMGDFGAADRERLLGEFVREGSLLAELSERSAAICQARDVGTLTTAGGQWAPYMVLEWLEGVTLERALFDDRCANRPPRTPLQAMNLLEPVAEALALAHARGIAHRDVKPGNIFLLGDPRGDGCAVKLLDFGIAKVVQDAQKLAGAFAKTTGQATSFTPAYGAPEQFSRQQGATGPWTDVFALGLIFTELLAGREALDGDDISQLAFASMDPSRRPTPRALGAPVSDAVESVIARALAVRTTDRFPTAGDFWNALREVAGLPPMRAITGRGTVPSLPAPEMVSAQMNAARTTLGAITSRRASSKTPLLAAGAALFLAIGAGGLFAARGAPSRASAPATAMPATVPVAAPPPRPACPEGMIEIPGGKFFMGSDDKDDLEPERPAHQVTLTPFCIDRYEVTVARYKACSDKGECKRAGMSNDWEGITEADRKAFDPLCNARDPDAKGKHPVNCVDWDQAASFCKASVPHGRLPTEAEWEFSARGPDGRKFPWGDEWPSAHWLNACDKSCMTWGRKNHVQERAMYEDDDGFATTAPVGSFPKGASRYGVEDVVGNVWEWTQDYYAPYTAASLDDPHGPEGEVDGSGRVIRGGAWNGAYPSWVRPTFRYHASAATRSYGYGFRCAADLK